MTVSAVNQPSKHDHGGFSDEEIGNWTSRPSTSRASTSHTASPAATCCSVGLGRQPAEQARSLATTRT